MVERRVGMLGAGNMAEALIRGLIGSGTLPPQSIGASDVRQQRLQQLQGEHAIFTDADNSALARWADIMVLAVKPQVIADVAKQIAPMITPDKLVISIAAGVSLRALEVLLPPGARVVRAMPNTGAIVLEAATALSRGAHATQDDLDAAGSLFDAVGRTVVVDESLMDAVTGLSGSGPAYVMLVLEALADGGVRMGLPRDVAVRLAAQTLHGAAKLQLQTGRHPAALRDMVTSPAGTTITALQALEKGAVRHALSEAVKAATERASELGGALEAKLRNG